MILADLEPTPGGFWQFCLIVAFISSVAVNVVTIVVLLANRKERREVSFAFEPASKAEFDEHKRRTEMAFAEIRQELRRDRDDILTAGTSRAQAIYNHIEQVRKELSESQQNLPDKIIALLKNTGAI